MKSLKQKMKNAFWKGVCLATIVMPSPSGCYSEYPSYNEWSESNNKTGKIERALIHYVDEEGFFEKPRHAVRIYDAEKKETLLLIGYEDFFGDVKLKKSQRQHHLRDGIIGGTICTRKMCPSENVYKSEFKIRERLLRNALRKLYPNK